MHLLMFQKSLKKILLLLGIRILPSWPPSSPDLNPIEHIWAWIQLKIRTHNVQTKEELKAYIILYWYAYKQIWIQKAIYCMPRRLTLVIASGGEKINY